MLLQQIQQILGHDKAALRSELGISRATLHRWETRGLPPILSTGAKQRIEALAVATLKSLDAQGKREESDRFYKLFIESTNHSIALNAWSIGDLKVYEHEDIEALLPTIERARQLWTQRCAESAREHGDAGTCVIGAGFYLSFLPEKSRKPRAWLFLSADSVTPYQGAGVWEKSVREVHRFLKDNGVECEYESGNMH
jgi:hypothetical protein